MNPPATAMTATSPGKARSRFVSPLVDLGLGLWHTEPTGRRYGAPLRARGKPGGIIVSAMAHRANKIAYAMVRDQQPWEPSRWAA